MSQFISGSSVSGEISIDTDPIEVGVERLLRKVTQNSNRQAVIVEARKWANDHAFLVGVPDLLEILSEDCDS